MRARPNAAPPEYEPPLVIGEVIDGRYLIEERLGEGGMASIYRATHLQLDQPVAIKVASESLLSMPGIVERFLQEARAATRLKTPHVARVHDVGKLTSGAPYMVMELLEGRDLDAVLREDFPLPVTQAVDYVLQACEALAEVHGRGMGHRDVKPGNLFVVRGADGRPWVKLIDFGIARAVSPVADDSRLTQPHLVMGSPRYMAPEQIEAAFSVDERADIYSLGVVLYELLTGQTPFEGETLLDFLYAATKAERVPPSRLNADVPRGLDTVVLECIEAQAANRFANVAELASALVPFGDARAHGRAENVQLVLTTANRDTGRSRPYEPSTSRTNERSRIARRPRLMETLEPQKKRGGGGGAMLAVGAIALTIAAFIFVRAKPLPSEPEQPEPSASATTNAGVAEPSPEPEPPKADAIEEENAKEKEEPKPAVTEKSRGADKPKETPKPKPVPAPTPSPTPIPPPPAATPTPSPTPIPAPSPTPIPSEIEPPQPPPETDPFDTTY